MAKLDSPRYTLLFAATVCVVCALMVSVAAVSLQPRQKANASWCATTAASPVTSRA